MGGSAEEAGLVSVADKRIKQENKIREQGPSSTGASLGQQSPRSLSAGLLVNTSWRGAELSPVIRNFIRVLLSSFDLAQAKTAPVLPEVTILA